MLRHPFRPRWCGESLPWRKRGGGRNLAAVAKRFRVPDTPIGVPLPGSRPGAPGGRPRPSRTVARRARIPRRVDHPWRTGRRDLQRRGRRGQPDLVPDPARAGLPGAHRQHHEHDRDMARLSGLGRRLPQGDRRPALPAGQLTPVGLAGGIAGALLLLTTSVATFDDVVPWLVLGASALFAAQPLLRRALDGARPIPAPGLSCWSWGSSSPRSTAVTSARPWA